MKSIYENPKIAIGSFVRQTFFDKNPHLSEQAQLDQINIILSDLNAQEGAVNLRRAAAQRRVRQGYREGVYLVSLIHVDGFKQRTRELVKGDYLFGEFKPRVKGEEPRKKISVLHVGELPDAKYVDAVLYARHVLEESGDYVEPGVDFEVVTFLAKGIEGDEPMEPDTLIANHYGFDGGTATKLSPEEFEAKLKESVHYWKDRAFCY